MDWEIQWKSFVEHETIRYDSSLICLETFGLCPRAQLESSPLKGHCFRDIDLLVAWVQLPMKLQPEICVSLRDKQYHLQPAPWRCHLSL